MTIFSLPYWMAVLFLFVLGAVAGSFLNVCIYRIPREERLWPALKGLWRPPSSCPRCRTRIAWHDNIPIVGWLLLPFFWLTILIFAILGIVAAVGGKQKPLPVLGEKYQQWFSGAFA